MIKPVWPLEFGNDNAVGEEGARQNDNIRSLDPIPLPRSSAKTVAPGKGNGWGVGMQG